MLLATVLYYRAMHQIRRGSRELNQRNMDLVRSDIAHEIYESAGLVRIITVSVGSISNEIFVRL